VLDAEGKKFRALKVPANLIGNYAKAEVGLRALYAVGPFHVEFKRTALCLVAGYLLIISTPLVNYLYMRPAALAAMALVFLAATGVEKLATSGQVRRRAGWIVLAVLVTLAAVISVEMSAVSMPEWFGVPSSGSRAASARSPANFENIVQRPLFARSRQGMVQAPVPLQAPPPPPASTLDRDVTLKGVFISGSIAKAFLLSPQNPLGLWVQAGEDIAGWNVVAVQPDQVILQGQGEKWIVQRNVGAK